MAKLFKLYLTKIRYAISIMIFSKTPLQTDNILARLVRSNESWSAEVERRFGLHQNAAERVGRDDETARRSFEEASDAAQPSLHSHSSRWSWEGKNVLVFVFFWTFVLNLNNLISNVLVFIKKW